jgi:hypothetical protein
MPFFWPLLVLVAGVGLLNALLRLRGNGSSNNTGGAGDSGGNADKEE